MATRFQLALLWLAMLLGLLAHSLLGMIAQAYSHSGAPTELEANLTRLLWQLTIVFSTHLLLAALNAFFEARWLTILNVLAGGLFLLSNLAHPVAHLLASPTQWHQVFLLLLIAGLNIQLVLCAVRSLRHPNTSP